MSSLTTRMGFYKPVGAEFVNVTTDLNNNWDKVDAYMGFASCTSSTRPSTVWAGLCIFETNTSKTYVSNGTGPASGSWIEIPNLASLINVTAGTTGTDAVTVNVTGDTQSRFIVNGSGTLEWGSGSGAVDTNLYRSGANALKTDDSFEAVGGLITAGTVNVTAAATSTDSFGLKLTGDSQNRFVVNGNSVIEWGSGAGTPDTNLFRNAANELKTDDNFTVGGDLSVAGIGQVRFIYKPAITSRSATTTLANDPDLTMTVAINATYRVEFWILGTSASATPNIKTAWTVPASTTGVKFAVGPTDTASGLVTRFNTNMRSTGHSFTTTCIYQLDGTGVEAIHESAVITTAGTSGSVTLQWSQGTSNATASSVDAGSYMVVTRLA